MKTPLILIAFTITAFTVNAQDLKISDVPEAVKSKFSSIYSNVNKISWEKENNYFEAEFMQN